MSAALIAIIGVLLVPGAQAKPLVRIAPFTDAQLVGVAENLAEKAAFPRVAGSLGQGALIDGRHELGGLTLNPVEGLVEMWIKPSWKGADGRRHLIWATERVAGHQLLLEKSELGMLRAVIETPDGRTVARGEVSPWKAGEWHHVAVGWISNHGANVGLALWIDKVAVDGPVTPHGVFDPAAMPKTLALGDDAGPITVDELIVRPDIKAEGGYGMMACVYRDFFRTAPYDAIRLEPDATRVPSDRRAVAGFEKQFGLQARRLGAWEMVTEQTVRYSQWAYFDAKRLIKWSTSDPSVATIDDTGRVKALKPGQCRVDASFHGLTASYPLTVISPDKPDLDAICIELLPRYRSDALKDRPAPGERVSARVRLGNFGLAKLPPGTLVRFEFFSEKDHNYRLDATDKLTGSSETTVPQALAPGEETSVEFKFPFPAESTWMKVTLDPDNKIDEFCKANNTIAELTDARPIHMGYSPKAFKTYYDGRKINHVGSLSYYDWIRAEKFRMDVMLREAVYPCTGPNGVEEAYRIDAMTALELQGWDNEPFMKENVYFDGGFPVNEPVDLTAIDCAIIHEFGHTILSQPDLYGYPVNASNVFLTDDQGKPIAGTPALPIVAGDTVLAASPAVNVPCDVGYPSLMDGCQLWLQSSQAGHVMFFKGYRPDRFWGTQGRLIPTRANWLMLTNADDRPLLNAAVYVYHVSQAPVQDSGAKYFADRPKFMGQTDDEGRFVFPGETDQDWDDPDTDVVDRSKPVWNPFGTPSSETAFTPNVWEVEGLLLLKIVSGKQTEYQFMDLTQFNTAFLSGERVCGKYPIRTSLTSSPQPTPLVRKPVPEAIRTVNKAPVAVLPKEITVKCGQQFVIDGSKSYDPEGQPLIFRWNVREGWLRGSLSQAPKLTLTAPDKPQDLDYKLWVIDGVRCSEAAYVKVHVVR